MTDVNVPVMVLVCEVSASSKNRSICAWGGLWVLMGDRQWINLCSIDRPPLLEGDILT